MKSKIYEKILKTVWKLNEFTLDVNDKMKLFVKLFE